MKQDLDLKNKQSFRILKSERDELETKLANEISSHKQDAERWLEEKSTLEATIASLQSVPIPPPVPSPPAPISDPQIPALKSKVTKYKKKSQQKSQKISSLQSSLSEQTSIADEYKAKFSQLQVRSEVVEKDNLKFKEELSQTKSDLAQLKTELAIKKEKYESLETRESYQRIQQELDQTREELGRVRVHRDELLQKNEYEIKDVKRDNVKMCQIIRDYEFQILEIQNSHKEAGVTLEARIKVLETEVKGYKMEIKGLKEKLRESNNDNQRLTEEYKNLVATFDDHKRKEDKKVMKTQKEKSLRKEYEQELARINHILSHSEDNKKEIIEKYAQELSTLKETYESTIQIQKSTFTLFKDKVDTELQWLQKFMKNKPKHPKFHERYTDLLQELSTKESNLKSSKTEVKSLKSQITKLKSLSKDLRGKNSELHKVIDANPRAKRMLEKQNTDLRMVHDSSVTRS